MYYQYESTIICTFLVDFNLKYFYPQSLMNKFFKKMYVSFAIKSYKYF